MWQWSVLLQNSSTILVWAWAEKYEGNEGHEKETKHIHAAAADLLHLRIRYLNWCKCGHRKNEAREINCPCCREVDAMLIALAKIPER